jgi:hypothetical protein
MFWVVPTPKEILERTSVVFLIVRHSVNLCTETQIFFEAAWLPGIGACVIKVFGKG